MRNVTLDPATSYKKEIIKLNGPIIIIILYIYIYIDVYRHFLSVIFLRFCYSAGHTDCAEECL